LSTSLVTIVLLDSVRRAVLVWVVLVSIAVMLVVELVCVLLGPAMSLELVVLVHAVSLGLLLRSVTGAHRPGGFTYQLVDLAAHEASEQFFGKPVFHNLALLPLLVLVQLESFKGCCACDELVRELALSLLCQY
jgi:hypothetical protein